MIDHAAGKQRFDRRIYLQVITLGLTGMFDECIHHPFMHGVAAGDHDAVEQHRVADL